MMPQQPDIAVTIAGALGDFRLDVAFTAPMRGITALFGPSGSGKTSILRCIAGLQRLPGHIRIGNDVWQHTDANIFVPPHRRHVGYVFQDAGLFAHLSVRDNLLYGARRSGSAMGHDLDGIVDMLAIGPLLGRSVAALSGGERQRVAVGRALLAAPRILLMDEPLSALDRDTKDEIIPYLEELREKSGVPILYVSHDLAEIERLADRVVLLAAGRALASGDLSDMQTDPRLPFLGARDAAVTLDGRIDEFDADYGLTTFAVAGGRLIVPGRHGVAGSTLRLRVAASDVSFTLLAATGSTILNCLPARVLTIAEQPGLPHVNIVVALGAEGEGGRVVARITRKSRDALALEPGKSVFAQIKSVALLTSRLAN